LELVDKTFNAINIDTNNFESKGSTFKAITKTTIEENDFGITDNASNKYRYKQLYSNRQCIYVATNEDTYNFTTIDNNLKVIDNNKAFDLPNIGLINFVNIDRTTD
jgi:hypothetical protein